MSILILILGVIIVRIIAPLFDRLPHFWRATVSTAIAVIIGICVANIDFENFASEKKDIHRNKENEEDSEGKKRFFRCKHCKKHHRKTENDCREVLVNHIVCRGSFEISVDFAKKNGTGTCGSGKHSVHHKELFFGIFWEKGLCDVVVIKIGDEKTDDSEDEHYSPIFFNNGKTDSRNSGNDHYIKEKVACAGKEKVVGIVPLDKVFLFEKAHYFFYKGRGKNAQKEVEAEDERSHSGKELADSVHKEIGYHIGDYDERYLNGHFVNAFLHWNFVFAFDFFVSSVLDRFFRDDAFSFKNVKVDNAADTCAQKSESGNGESETFSAFKSEVVFIDSAVVHCLTGSLTIAEGEKNARCFKKFRNKESCDDDSDRHSENRLKKIGGNSSDAGIENLDGSFFGNFSVRGFKGGSDKT